MGLRSGCGPCSTLYRFICFNLVACVVSVAGRPDAELHTQWLVVEVGRVARLHNSNCPANGAELALCDFYSGLIVIDEVETVEYNPPFMLSLDNVNAELQILTVAVFGLLHLTGDNHAGVPSCGDGVE